MKIKVLILILPSFLKLSIFPSQKLLHLGLWNLWQFCFFAESVTSSDGYRRGYVSFAHFLLYLILLNLLRKSNQMLDKPGIFITFPQLN